MLKLKKTRKRMSKSKQLCTVDIVISARFAKKKFPNSEDQNLHNKTFSSLLLLSFVEKCEYIAY